MKRNALESRIRSINNTYGTCMSIVKIGDALYIDNTNKDLESKTIFSGSILECGNFLLGVEFGLGRDAEVVDYGSSI